MLASHPSSVSVNQVPGFVPAKQIARKIRTALHAAVFFFLFAALLFLLHASLLNLRPFWDEAGQFLPTALDLLRHGWWVTRTAIPNVHPPGVEIYLVLWYKIFGYSIVVTRVAMLFVAAFGLLLTFLLAIELTRGLPGAPAFLPPLLLLVSPLFFMQSLMAQLDMPAMVLTLLTVLLFLHERYAAAALAGVALVLVKETALVTPFVLCLLLLRRRGWKHAAWFIAPPLALGGWLLILHRSTGYWLGDPGFAHYNIAYSLHPVRLAVSFLRRLYYLFFAEFRFLGTLALLLVARSCSTFQKREWRDVLWIAAGNLLVVSVLGGAELERYSLPVLPLLYIGFTTAFAQVKQRLAAGLTIALLAGLFINIFWNPPYPFPYENNYAMVDFVRLEQSAAEFAENDLPSNTTVATAWPYTAGFRNPDFGFVHRKLRLVETGDFDFESIQAIAPTKFDVLIAYTRTWDPAYSVTTLPFVRELLHRFYSLKPPVTPEQCEQLGLFPHMTLTLRGQTVTVYTRSKVDHRL